MIRSANRLLDRIGGSAIILFALSLVIGPAAAGQDASPPPMCAMLTADEVATALGVTDVMLSKATAASCSFYGEADLRVGVIPGGDIEKMREYYGAGVTLTVANAPAWFHAQTGSLYVDLGDLVLFLGGRAGSDRLLERLVGLAELAAPRVPAGPPPEVVARLEAILPDTIGGETVTVISAIGGDLLSSYLDAEDSSFPALVDALVAQGRSTTDLAVASGQVPSWPDERIIVVELEGADASGIVVPFVKVFMRLPDAFEVSTKQLGGKDITVVSSGRLRVYAYSFGDHVLYTTLLERLFFDILGSLP